MNIIQVCPYDLSIPGGVQTHITHLSNELMQNNHNVLVIAPSLKNSGFRKKFDCDIKHITDSRRIKIWGTSIDISIMNRAEKKEFNRILGDFAPDVIHFHTIWNPFMQTQMVNMVGDRIKCVATFHDTPPDFGIGKFIGGNLMKLGARYYFSKLDESISVSKSQAKAMGVDIDSPPEHFQVIPNGIDSTVIDTYKSENSSGNQFKLIFIGRLEERKGLLDLLEVYKRLQSGISSKEISLSILGDGPLMVKVQKYVSEHDLSSITFYPEASDEIKFRLLGQSDLLVAPSLYGESFGIVLLEAMALGVKVVGYGNAGYLNIGKQYGEENFPEPGNKKKLYEVIKHHILHPGDTDCLIKKGFEIAREHDWKRITKKIEKVYSR